MTTQKHMSEDRGQPYYCSRCGQFFFGRRCPCSNTVLVRVRCVEHRGFDALVETNALVLEHVESRRPGWEELLESILRRVPRGSLGYDVELLEEERDGRG